MPFAHDRGSACDGLAQMFDYGDTLMLRLHSHRQPFGSFSVGAPDLVSVHLDEAVNPLNLANFRAQIDKLASPLEGKRQCMHREQARHPMTRVMHAKYHRLYMVEGLLPFLASENT